MRFLHYGRKERSDGIASKQMRLVRASMTILSQACRYYIFSHLDRRRVKQVPTKRSVSVHFRLVGKPLYYSNCLFSAIDFLYIDIVLANTIANPSNIDTPITIKGALKPIGNSTSVDNFATVPNSDLIYVLLNI